MLKTGVVLKEHHKISTVSDMAQNPWDLNSLKENLPPSCPVKSKPELQPQLELTVLSWNINGPGLAKHRNRLVPAVVRQVNPDVLLLQETKTDKLIRRINEENSNKYKPFETHKKDESIETHKKDESIETHKKDESIETHKKDESIETHKKDESRVLYDSSIYEDVTDYKIFPGLKKGEFISLMEIFEKSIPAEEHPRELRGKVKKGMRDLYKDRIAFVGLKRKDPNSKRNEENLSPEKVTIFMSFHNVHTSQGIEVREKAAAGFCQIVEKIRDWTGCVVMGGADFNQTMTGPLVLLYTPTLRREKKVIDYIILAAPPGRVRWPEVTAMDFVGAKEDILNPLHGLMRDLLRPDGGNAPDYDKAIDHDPLVCHLQITLPSPLSPCPP